MTRRDARSVSRFLPAYIKSLAMVLMFAASAAAQQTPGLYGLHKGDHYTSPRRWFSIPVPKPSGTFSFFQVPYVPMDSFGIEDANDEVVIFGASDLGQYLIAGVRVIPDNMADQPVRSKKDYFIDNANGILQYILENLTEAPEIRNDSFIETQFGTSLMRVYYLHPDDIGTSESGAAIDRKYKPIPAILLLSLKGNQLVYSIAEDYGSTNILKIKGHAHLEKQIRSFHETISLKQDEITESHLRRKILPPPQEKERPIERPLTEAEIFHFFQLLKKSRDAELAPEEYAFLQFNRKAFENSSYASWKPILRKCKDIQTWTETHQSLWSSVTSDARDSSPAWSPDGSKIAFVSNRQGNNDIFVMNPDGTGVMQLTKGPEIDEDPIWSPDGKWLAFTRCKPNEVMHKCVFIIGADGDGEKELSDGDRLLLGSWSCDSRLIAFLSGEKRKRLIHLAGADGENVISLRQRGSDCTFIYPIFSPVESDGKLLMIARCHKKKAEIFLQVHVIEIIDGKSIESSNVSGSLIANFNEPIWHPDGKTILFIARTSGNKGSDAGLYSVATDGTNLTRLTPPDMEISHISCSPSGSKIAFIAYTSSKKQSSDDEGHDIFIMQLSDRKITSIPSSYDYGNLTWSPDGTKLAFQGEREGRDDIYVISVDGTGEMNLTAGATRPINQDK